MNCEECTKEVTQTPGKRTKRFCNSTCRSNHWQKQKVLEKKAVNTIEESKPILPQKTVAQSELKIGVDLIEKDKDPKENSMGFFLKYNCNTYLELQEKISNLKQPHT